MPVLTGKRADFRVLAYPGTSLVFKPAVQFGRQRIPPPQLRMAKNQVFQVAAISPRP
jgi:hypothetical protein